jgi:hypothetical protein
MASDDACDQASMVLSKGGSTSPCQANTAWPMLDDVHRLVCLADGEGVAICQLTGCPSPIAQGSKSV